MASSTKKYQLIALVALAIVFFAAFFYLQRITRAPCWILNEISADPVENERLRLALADFINQPLVRSKLNGIPYIDGIVITNQNRFDVDSFPWEESFLVYPQLHHLGNNHEIELILKIDAASGRLTVPYRVEEIGVYAGRVIIMFRNENDRQYERGPGADRLSRSSCVKCDMSASRIASSTRKSPAG